jgi:ABC-type multidrug transport system fused ATPase/permease subunit
LGLSIAFTVSWRLSLALLGALPLLGAAEGAQQTLMISGEKNIGKALNASAEIVNESVKSAKEIQAFGLQSVVSCHLLWCCDNDFVLLGDQDLQHHVLLVVSKMNSRISYS